MNEYVAGSCLYTVYHSQIQCFLLADYEHYRVGSFCPEKILRLPLLCSQRLVMSYAASNSALHYSDLKSLQCLAQSQGRWKTQKMLGAVFYTLSIPWKCLQKDLMIPGACWGQGCAWKPSERCCSTTGDVILFLMQKWYCPCCTFGKPGLSLYGL